MPVPEVGDHVGDFSLPGGVLEHWGFDRRSYMLCRQRGSPLLITVTPEGGSSSYAERLAAYADRLESCRPGTWALWAISPRSLDSHEELARHHGLTMPLLSDTDFTVAQSFGVANLRGKVNPSAFLIASNRTLLWKHVSVLEPPQRLPWDLMQRLVT